MTEYAYLAWVGTDGDQTIEYMMYSGIAVVLLIVSLFLYVAWLLLCKYVLHRKVAKNKSFFVSLALVLTGFILVYILPAAIEEKNWQTLQMACAKQVGYDSPADNNNSQVATYLTQREYRQCLLMN